MRRVPLHSLKPGMKLGRPVFDSEGRILLREGVVLTERFIKRLKKLGIPSVYINNGFLPDVEFNDVISETTRFEAMACVKNLFQEYSVHKCLSLQGLKKVENIVEEIIEDLLANKNLVVNMADIRSHDAYTFGHSVNVCVLSCITGIRLGYDRKRLSLLARGAIMHDIGKTLIPLKILNKPGSLTPDEMEVVRRHCENGYRILLEMSGFSKVSAIVALQHHERYDGSGYPEGLRGSAIHEFAVITGVADMYDAITSDRVYRNAFNAHEAYEMLAATGDFLFRYDVVRAFLYHVAAYPLGSLVELSDGSIGVVVETPPGYSLRPKVRIFFDRRGRALASPYDISLADDYTLAVTRVIKDEVEIDRLKEISMGKE